MQQTTYNRFRDVVYDATGISLGPSKQALVAARVGKCMRVLGITDYREYLARVAADDTGVELTRLVDAICTNVTSFFREEDHFAFVRRVVSEQRAAGCRRFRIWSAACSTGEEVYSLAITLHDLASEDCDIRILGTDLSTKALRAAQEGMYAASRLADVHPEIRRTWFTKHGSGERAAYSVKQELRDMVVFRKINLSRPPFALNGPLDIVLCRNVMIYFDLPVRERLLAEIHRLLAPGGYLSLGHAESLSDRGNGFKAVQPSTYVRC